METFVKNNITPVNCELKEETQLVINNILKVFIELKDENKVKELDFKKPINLTASCCGVSFKTVHQIRFKFKPTENDLHRCRGKPSYCIDDVDKSVVREMVMANYASDKIPSLTKITQRAYRDIPGFRGSFQLMKKILKDIGYKYKKTEAGKKRLVEKKSIACSRLEFLRILDQLRKDGDTRPRIYLDEMWITRYLYKIRTSETQLRRGNKFILCHAGCAKYGFIETAEWIFRVKNTNTKDLHTKMTAKAFTEWFKLLLQSLGEPSVIIMDNAFYHAKRINEGPTKSSSKEEIEEWLKEYNIAYSETALKAELLKIVKENRPKKDYVLDQLAYSWGHEVVRMPLFHKQYNPMASIWDKVKKEVEDKSETCREVDIEELVHEAIGNVTKEDWKQCVEKAEARQDEDFKKVLSNDQTLADTIQIE